jgi:hypothetical protein
MPSLSTLIKTTNPIRIQLLNYRGFGERNERAASYADLSQKGTQPLTAASDYSTKVMLALFSSETEKGRFPHAIPRSHSLR